MFFGLFGITNRASSIIGPIVVQAIIGYGNNWMGFVFLFAICAVASIGVACVNVEKGRIDCRSFVEERKIVRVAMESGLTRDQVTVGASGGSMETPVVERT